MKPAESILGAAVFALLVACNGMDCSGLKTDIPGISDPSDQGSHFVAFKTPLHRADFDAMDEARRQAFVLALLGFEPKTARPEKNEIVIDEDIVIPRSQLDGYIKAYLAGEFKKNYGCAADFRAGVEGGFCWPIRVSHPNSIHLNIDSGVHEGWRRAFVEAAYVWSTRAIGGKEATISIDTDGIRWNRWTIHVTAEKLGDFAARSRWPAYIDVGHIQPGQQIQVNNALPLSRARRNKTAIHQLGHTLGFTHPGQGARIPGTPKWTHPSLSCLAPGRGKYRTMMCKGDPMALNFMSPDDSRAAVTLYPKTAAPFNRNTWNWDFCSTSNPCSIGEGDCDDDKDCAGYLICSKTAAPRYGAPQDADVCVAPTTQRGEGVPCALPLGGARCDDPACPCGVGEGDCDSDVQCSGQMTCARRAGAAIGITFKLDICIHPKTPECPAVDRNHIKWNFCTPACPCSFGEGDCNTSEDCIGDLVCAKNLGEAFGFALKVDVCTTPGLL